MKQYTCPKCEQKIRAAKKKSLRWKDFLIYFRQHDPCGRVVQRVMT